MTVSLALCASLLAVEAQSAAGSTLPPVCIEKPVPAPVTAKIDGQVRRRNGAPAPGIEVQARVGKELQEYKAISDQQGRYVVTGFDTGPDVELIFRDFTDSAFVSCGVRPSNADPVVSVDVTIGLTGRDEIAEDVGCELAKGKRKLPSWTGTGNFQLAPKDKYFPEPEPSPLPTLALRTSDIAEVHWTADAAILRLADSGREALTAFTTANIGRPTLTTIDGEPLGRGVWIQGTIDSGMMQVSERDLRGRPLCRILATVSKGH